MRKTRQVLPHARANRYHTQPPLMVRLARLGKGDKLTIDDIPQHRVSNDRLALHYPIKQLDTWLSSAQVSGLRRRGVRVEYA